jgi:hypothetical protein
MDEVARPRGSPSTTPVTAPEKCRDPMRGLETVLQRAES